MYRPITPAAALRAIEQGVLPSVAFIYRAGSVKPLFEQPADLEEIQRILAKPNLDLDTTLLVLDILYEMLDDADPERALFAAESINGIENRYMERIERLLEAGDAPIELAHLYNDLARIHGRRQSLRSFYLDEGLKWMERAVHEKPKTADTAALHARLLIERGDYDDAREVLTATEDLSRNPSLLLLLAELEFRQRHFVRVIAIFQHLQAHDLARGTTIKDLAEQWGSEQP
jgi:tetratricopeptide (TPR) repeat protein